MGTHPIFESDFDCLTEGLSRSKIAQCLIMKSFWIPLLLALVHAKLHKCFNDDWDQEVIQISKAKGGIPLTAFGATFVRIWSEKSQIRVVHSNSRTELTMNRKSYFQTVLAALLERPLSEHSFQVNPIQDHFFRAERARPALTFSSTSETLCYEAQFQLVSFWRIAPLLIGLWLFYNACHLSSVLSFHYFGGMSVGVLLAGLGLVFLVARMVPRRGGFV